MCLGFGRSLEGWKKAEGHLLTTRRSNRRARRLLLEFRAPPRAAAPAAPHSNKLGQDDDAIDPHRLRVGPSSCPRRRTDGHFKASRAGDTTAATARTRPSRLQEATQSTSNRVAHSYVGGVSCGRAVVVVSSQKKARGRHHKKREERESAHQPRGLFRKRDAPSSDWSFLPPVEFQFD